MSELEACRLAHEGNLLLLKEKISSDKVENLTTKRDSVSIEINLFFFIKLKTDLNQSGRQPLHWACVGGKKEVVDYLISEHNVSLEVADEVKR